MDDLSTDSGNAETFDGFSEALTDVLSETANGRDLDESLSETADFYKVDPAVLKTAYLNHMKMVERARYRIMVAETVDLVMAISTSLQKYPR